MSPGMPVFDMAPALSTDPNRPEPDRSILRPERPRPPTLPLSAFGPAWAEWITAADG